MRNGERAHQYAEHETPRPHRRHLRNEGKHQDENGAGGNGMHRGYSIDELKSGDQIFQRYEGTHKLVVKDGGAWEVTYQGKAEIIGGTGKYKNARGQLKYKGRITADGTTEDDTGDIEY